MVMTAWFDAHLHLQDPRLGDARAVARTMKSAGVDRALINATRQSDWNEVHALVAWSMGEGDAPELIPAYGIHPWQAEGVSGDWRDDLEEYLATHPRASVGEIGLDGWVESPAMEIQRPVFRAQWELAVRLGKPATIHCLKAWGPLMEELRACPPGAPFLMHSYGGSLELARELAALGAYFSFSGYFLHPRKARVVEVFRQLPPERILVETDAPDMAPPAQWIRHPLPGGFNHPANLEAVGEGLAAHLGVSVEELRLRSAQNARDFLGG